MWALASSVVLLSVTTAWLLFLSTGTAHADQVRNVTLQVPGLGVLRGSLNASYWTNRTIYQFQGIPFGKPPVGPLRFKPPEPAEPWRGILDTTKFRNKCPVIQRTPHDHFRKEWTYLIKEKNVEDCLYLNIYTTKFGNNIRNPVMVYFHGGSFRVGSAQEFWPTYLLEKDIVLVVPQYRLGPLGFLSLQTEDIPGNVGLLDQVLALRWIQKYISYFGGDPKQVTIFGQSAGGASVTLMQVSPLVDRSLFSKVILQSGSALGTWVMDKDPVKSARSIARHANCSFNSIAELSDCLREISAPHLLLAHSNFLIEDLMSGGRGTGGNHPVIQNAGSQKFLVEAPLQSIHAGRFNHVPMMGGVTRHEGSFILGNLYDIILQNYNLLNNTDYLKHNLTRTTLKFSGIEDPTGMVADILNEKYFQPGKLGNFKAMIPGLIDICGVALLKASTYHSVQENSRLEPSFLYSFNYYGEHTKFGNGEEMDYPFTGGVAHSDDLIYLFPQPRFTLNEEDKAMARTMVEMWTNFATYGKPTPAQGMPEWPPVSTETGPYLRIDRISQIRENFIDEYTIAVREGIRPSRASTLQICFIALVLLIITNV